MWKKVITEFGHSVANPLIAAWWAGQTNNCRSLPPPPPPSIRILFADPGVCAILYLIYIAIGGLKRRGWDRIEL